MTQELHHLQSEQSVLGGLMIDPNAFDRIDWLQESDFYRHEHRIIFNHIVRMLVANKPVDVITVSESLLSAGVKEDHCGLAYLGELAANTPTAANIARYAEIVRDKRKLRDLLSVSAKIADLTQEQQRPVADLIDESQALVFKLAEEETESDEPEAIGSMLSSVIDDIQARYDSDSQITGLSTGFVDLDEKTCGLSGGDLVIVAGRPSMGKTSFALNIAENVAVGAGLPVAVFSMEMPKKQLTERALSSVGKIPLQNIRSGKMTDDDFGRLSFALGKLCDAKLVIDDKPALRVSQMRSRCRRIVRKHGSIALIVVDYIQLATGDGQQREQEVSGVSRGLKALAKEFNVPVIALSQLNRSLEQRQNKRPVMSDLRESGAIEQDADLIIFLYRDEVYHKDSPDTGMAEAIIAKQRNGPLGDVRLVFRGEFCRFETASYEAQAEAIRRRESANTTKVRRGME